MDSVDFHYVSDNRALRPCNLLQKSYNNDFFNRHGLSVEKCGAAL